MSTDKPMVSIDGEWLLKRIQQIEFILDNIRTKAATGSFVQQAPEGIDLDAIDWKGPNKKPFHPGDTWGWAFAYDEGGGLKPETEALVIIIERDGKATIDGYTIKLGGRNNTLLNRQKVKRPQ